jgi:two-component system cell cycle sensor histidine kinase/response regulator CckA
LVTITSNRPGTLPDEDEALVASRLAAIVETSVDAIVSKRLDGTIVSWNRAAQTIFGYAPEEIIGESVFKLIPPELHDEETEILQRIARGESVSHYETTRIRKDGRRITISLTVSPVLDSSGSIAGAASIKRDITQSKKAEETLRQAAKMESIGRLAGGLAHDFNNHLLALTGFVHLVGRDANLSTVARSDLVQIQKVAERMASLTRQLLAFARQQVLTLEILDLNAVIVDAHLMLQRLLGSNYELRQEQESGPLWVRLDRGQVVQVLMNLVINARDAMPSGGLVIVRTMTLTATPEQNYDRNGNPVAPGPYAVLKVVDHGRGIESEDLPRIFEPFFTTKQTGEGTGLGLATVDGIVSQSDGHIQLETSPGRGTTFTVLFPLTPPEGIAGEESSPESEPGRPGRILVVDDDDNVRIVVSRMLQQEGYEVVAATNGIEALACMAREGDTIDLVLTDVVMPGMGGPELIKRLQASHPAVPAISMSGYPRDAYDDQESTHLFLQKPVSPEALFQAVKNTARVRPA